MRSMVVRQLVLTIGVATALVGTSCAGASNDAVTAGPAGTSGSTGTTGSGTVAAAECTRPMSTLTGDAFSYPASLDEIAAQADLIVEGRVMGEASPAVVQGEIGMT